jgi:hypothetical protein
MPKIKPITVNVKLKIAAAIFPERIASIPHNPNFTAIIDPAMIKNKQNKYFFM